MWCTSWACSGGGQWTSSCRCFCLSTDLVFNRLSNSELFLRVPRVWAGCHWWVTLPKCANSYSFKQGFDALGVFFEDSLLLACLFDWLFLMNGDYCEHGDSLANREVSDIFERLLVQLHRPFHLSYNWYYESTRYISFLVNTLLQPHKTQTQNNINVGSHKSFRELVTRHVVHLPLLPSRHVFIVYARRVAAENRVTLRHPQL